MLSKWIFRAKWINEQKAKEVCTTPDYIKHFHILAFAFTAFASVFAFAFLLDIPVGMVSSAVGLKICAIVAGIKKFKSKNKKKKRKHNKIELSTKSKLNSIEALNSIALIDSNISHDEFALIKNMLKEYDDMEKEAKNFDNK